MTVSAGPRRLSAKEVDGITAALSRLYGDVRVEASGALEWGADVAELGDVTVVRGAAAGEARLHVSTSAHVLLIPTHGWARVNAPGVRVAAVPGRTAVLSSPGEPLVVATAARLATHVARLAPGVLVAQLEALTGHVVRGPIRFSPEVPLDVGLGAFLDHLCGLVVREVLDGPILTHPMLLGGLQDSIASALLTGVPHDHAHLLEKPPPSSGPRVVRLVEEYVREHAGEAIRAVDLVALTGAGMASIEEAFRVHRGTSPAAFLRARRLERARQRLLSGTSVSMDHVAQDAGFVRRASFEAAYRSAFGESPEETRRRGLLAGLDAAELDGERAALAARFGLLSPREREVCAALAEGLLNKQIAARFGVSEGTIKKQRASAMAKLGISSTAELATLLEKLQSG